MKYTEIKWRDIASVSGYEQEWYSVSDATERAKMLYDTEYITIGTIINETEEFVVIATTYDPFQETYSDISMIPKVNIIKKIDIPVQ